MYKTDKQLKTFCENLKKRKEFRDNQDDTDDYLKTRRCIVYIDLVCIHVIVITQSDRPFPTTPEMIS